jgi:hypothetical protein
VRGVRDDEQVALAAFPGLGARGEGDPAAQYVEGGLARAGVFGEGGILGEGDDGLPECLLVPAEYGLCRAGAVGGAGCLAADSPGEELACQRVEG